MLDLLFYLCRIPTVQSVTGGVFFVNRRKSRDNEKTEWEKRKTDSVVR